MKDRSRLELIEHPESDEVEVRIVEFVPTKEEIKLMATKPLPKGLLAIDSCGAGTQEYRHTNPLATWQSLPIPYAFETSVPQTLRDGINRSFEAFTSLSNFFRHGVLSDAKIKISIGPIDLTGRTLAESRWYYQTSNLETTRATIKFDSGEKWAWLPNESCGANGSTYDIGHVAVHEIGHLLGLAHAPTDPLQTMFASTPPGKTLGRTLGNGDILGIRKAYSLPEDDVPDVSETWIPLVNEMDDALNRANDVLNQMRLRATGRI